MSAYSKTEKQSGFPSVLHITVQLTGVRTLLGKRLQSQLLTILLAEQEKEAAALGACRPVHETRLRGNGISSTSWERLER